MLFNIKPSSHKAQLLNLLRASIRYFCTDGPELSAWFGRAGLLI